MVVRLVFYYIWYSLRLLSSPWRYFQINAKYFNSKIGAFSKIDIDSYIPNKWLLKQDFLDKNNPPDIYPVFLKPEWGQNSDGVRIIKSLDDFHNTCAKLKNNKTKYIIQSLANFTKEFEIFYIQHPDNKLDFATITIVEAINSKDSIPINSIYNSNTKYCDISADFNTKNLDIIKNHLRLLPRFKIARVGIKADSTDDLILGNFKIIEINLFTPMPLNLLDTNISKYKKINFIKKSMYSLARLSSGMSNTYFKKFIFFKKIVRHYSTK